MKIIVTFHCEIPQSPENRPTLENKPTRLFWMELLQRLLCSQKYAYATIYATVHAVMLSKKHQGSSTVQEEG